MTANSEEAIERRIDKLLVGAIDPHVHSGPSIAPRAIDHLELLQQASAAGFAAIVTKDHDYSGVMTAELIKRHHPELKTKIFSSIVLNNVISNGIKFSRESGRPVAVTVSHTPPHVIVRVRDRGEGVAPDDAAFIFEPFYRADKSRSRRTGGYGLGLSLCKTIMDAHKGRIEIHSHGQPGEGTTVSLFFPDSLSEKG